jgi:hypothetical protein
LISTGQSPDESYFGDASTSGGDVFFFTRQSLVSQDQDNNVDVYDAREHGGLASQNAVATSPCVSERCRGSSSTAPAFEVPSSVTLSGSGNLGPPVLKTRGEGTDARAKALAAALKACARKPKSKRAPCRARARRKYGTKAKKSNGRGS